MTDLKSLLRDAEPAPTEVDIDAVIGRGDHLRRQHRQRTAGAFVAAALVLMAGVMGVVNRTDGTADRPVALLAGAGDAVRDAGSARMRVVMEASSDEHSSRTEIVGVVDFAANRGLLTATTDGEQISIIGSGAIVYVSVPESDRVSTDGKPWLSYPASDTSDSVLDLGDPAHLLDELRETEGVEVVGNDDVNGFETTHYAATITDDSVEGGPGIAGRADVWITGDGLPTRVSLDYDLGLSKVAIRVDLTEFGIEVDDVDPPDEGDVFAGTEEMANQWFQPQLVDAEALAGFADGLACSVLPRLADALQQQAETMSEAQIATMEQALAQMDAQANSIDDSTPEGAQQKAAVLASTSTLRELVIAARTGEPIDPAAVQTTFDQLGRSCTDDN